MSSTRSTWISAFLVALAVGLGVVLVVTAHAPSSAERLARANNLFESFRQEDLLEIVIEQPTATESSVILRKDPLATAPDAYFLGGAGETRADPQSVASLLRALDFASWRRRIDGSDVAHDAFGLSAPVLEVRLRFADRDFRLLIGQEAPTPPGSYYAEVRGPSSSHVGVVPQKLVDELLVDPRSFRARLLLPYAKSELAEISLNQPAAAVLLSADALGFRIGDERWRADRELTDRMLFQFARVRISEFIDEDLGKRLLDQSPATLTIRQVPKAGAAITVRLGPPCPGHPELVVAERTEPEPLAGCVTRTVMPSLQVTAAALVDASLLPLDADEIDHVLVLRDGATLDLIRKDAAFELLGSQNRAVPLALGNEFLQALTGTRGSLFVGPAPTAAPTGTLTVIGNGNATPGAPAAEVRLSLRLWERGDDVLVERQDDGARILIPRSAAWFLEGDSAWARERKLLPLAESELQEVSVRQESGVSRLTRKGDSWELAEPAGFATDPALSRDLLRALSELPVVRFLPVYTKFSVQPRATVEISTRDRAEPVTIEIGERTRGGYLGRSSLDQLPFVLSSETVRKLVTLPIDRSPFLLDPRQFETLELWTPRAHYRFERRGDTLAGSAGPRDAELASALTEALNELQPLAAAHPGPAHAAEGFSPPELRLSGTQHTLDGKITAFELTFGALGVFQGRAAQWARASGTNASFYVDRRALQEVMDLL